MNNSVVELKSITKSYLRVNALEDVSLEISLDETIGLIGDNGAGKSTLIKVLSGVVVPDKGEIWVKQQRVTRWNAGRSRSAGIETVYQDRALVGQQSIVTNIFMGRELVNRFGFIDIARQYAEAEKLMRDIGFTSKSFNPDSIVATLSGGERQGVAIARAVYFDAEIIVLDEPTTALSLTETHKVFSFVEAVRSRGRSVVFIDHNINHVYDIADRIIILDRGKVVLQVEKKDIPTADSLAANMRAIARTGIPLT